MGLLVSLVRFGAPEAAANTEAIWLEQPGPEFSIRTASRMDPAMDAGEIRGGLVTSGLSRIDFRPKGEYVVEVFVAAQDAGAQSFVLEEGHSTVGANLRLRALAIPASSAPIQFRVLMGVVHGPVELWVRSSAAEYAISAIRWRTREEYERDVVPVAMARARKLAEDSSIMPGAAERQRVLRQLWERASLTHESALEREAWVGMTRAFYWEAMHNPDGGHLTRLDDLLERSMRIAGTVDVTHEMVTAACAGTNVPQGTPPAMEGVICKDARAVFWRSKAVPKPEAPGWAEAQRRVRIRLEEIAAYWTKRQKADGSLGDGWQGELAGEDVAMMANWAPLAAGLGSATAASGMEKMAAGLAASGLLAGGYDKRVGLPAQSARLSSAWPYLALVKPDNAAARLREVSRCLPFWIRKQQDGRYRVQQESYNCGSFDDEARYVDSWRNLAAVGPVLWHAFLTGDAETVSSLWYWGEAWEALMLSNEGGKPSGVIPEEMFSANGTYLTADEGWLPENWSGEGQRAITSLFAALHDLKQEERWLNDYELSSSAEPPAARPVAGEGDEDAEPAEAPAPVGQALRQAPAPTIASLPQRFLLGLTRKKPKFTYFDHHVAWDGGAKLEQAAQAFEKALSVNLPMYTSEALFTDRVFYAVPEEYQRMLFGGHAPRPDRYPAFAVSWTPSNEQYARAVIDADAESLRLKVYNFEAGIVSADFRAWRLRPGRYTWSIAETKQQGEVMVDAAKRYFSIPMAPGRELTIEIRRR